MRSPRKLIGTDPVCPSDEEKTGARAMTTDEVRRLRDDFIEAAARSKGRVWVMLKPMVPMATFWGSF